MATRSNTDYVRFSAFSIKDLIIRKLAQDAKFSDQIFPGSNLNILIDIFSYIAQTLLYNTNSVAAESMFSDTKIYENINRLCAFLGYNPHGMNPATAIFSFPLANIFGEEEIASVRSLIIPRYSYIDTNLNDSNGNRIFFSTVEDIEVNPNSTAENQEIVMYNGRWKLYNTIFTAEGTDWETFVLNGLRSDSSTSQFVANNYIHIYVAEPKEDGTYGPLKRFVMTDGGLYKSRNEYFDKLGNDGENPPIPSLYNSENNVFNLRLDETKTYVITFGNNRQGHRLTKGSAIYVFYLDSNGPIPQFGINQIRGSLKQDFSSYRISEDGRVYDNIYAKVLGITNLRDSSYIFGGIENVINVTQTDAFAAEETVDEIRDFSPNWFRMGNRLVTQRDYEYYLNNSPAFRGVYADVKCMNNWGYMSTFYKWLYEMGKKYQLEINPDDKLGGRRFLKQDNILKTQRKYADPADSNNIYLWIVPSSSSILDSNDNSTWLTNAADWKKALLQIKDLTHEPYFIPVILTKFAICANSDYDYIRNNYLNTNSGIDTLLKENYIEITIDDEVLYANASIKSQIQTIIFNFFRAENFKIGQYVNFNLLQDQIFSINGVNRIRTVFKPADDVSTVPVIVKNGLCFASWTDDPILQIRNQVEGIDLDVSSAGRSLEPFQFPYLAQSNTTIDVRIIKRSAASLNTVAY